MASVLCDADEPASRKVVIFDERDGGWPVGWWKLGAKCWADDRPSRPEVEVVGSLELESSAFAWEIRQESKNACGGSPVSLLNIAFNFDEDIAQRSPRTSSE